MHRWKESQLKGIISDQEYSYCWTGKSVTEIASYKPDMSGIIPKRNMFSLPPYFIVILFNLNMNRPPSGWEGGWEVTQNWLDCHQKLPCDGNQPVLGKQGQNCIYFRNTNTRILKTPKLPASLQEPDSTQLNKTNNILFIIL